jgi:myo-inositol-1(or 4)-monophosphatase
MADLDLQRIHDHLVNIAHKAGKMILSANPNMVDTDTKKNCALGIPNTLW